MAHGYHDDVSRIGRGYDDTSSSDTGWGGSHDSHVPHAHHIGMGLLMAVMAFPRLFKFLSLAALAYLLNPF